MNVAGRLHNDKLEAVESPEFQPGLTYSQIFDTYRQSYYGIYHNQQRLRYNNFKYDRSQMLGDLGNDVHPLQHMQHTHDEIVQPMLRAQVNTSQDQELSVDDIKVLRLTSLLHDIGECSDPLLETICGKVVDDIPHHEKKAEDETAESVIRRHLYAELFQVLPDSHLETIEEIILQKDTSDHITKYFRASEDLGYYLTGIRAANIAMVNIDAYLDRSFKDDVRLTQLGKMAVAVVNSWHGTLEDRANEYPYVSKRLNETKIILRAVNKSILVPIVVG